VADLQLCYLLHQAKISSNALRFWDDIWFGGNCLKTTFARLYSLESNKQCLNNERCSLIIGSIHFTWDWRCNLRSGQELDQLDTLMGLLQHHCPSPIDDRWDFTLHHSNIYFNSYAFKPDSRGIELHSLLCPVCDDSMESAQHLFLHCNLASDVWSSVFKWWKVDNVPNTPMDLITWVNSANIHVVAKNIMDGVILTTVWVQNLLTFMARLAK
ncbi:reverse transcriptase domain, reverse transcriptase zinc-binding domain protein, partial [Tanacetum coccineum]